MSLKTLTLFLLSFSYFYSFYNSNNKMPLHQTTLPTNIHTHIHTSATAQLLPTTLLDMHVASPLQCSPDLCRQLDNMPNGRLVNALLCHFNVHYSQTQANIQAHLWVRHVPMFPCAMHSPLYNTIFCWPSIMLLWDVLTHSMYVCSPHVTIRPSQVMCNSRSVT